MTACMRCHTLTPTRLSKCLTYLALTWEQCYPADIIVSARELGCLCGGVESSRRAGAPHCSPRYPIASRLSGDGVL